MERPGEWRQPDAMWRSQQGTHWIERGLGYNLAFVDIEMKAYFGSLPTKDVNV